MNRIGLWSAIGVLLAATGGYGSLIAPQSLLDLERNADLIVVAAASGASQAGPTVGFSLRVSRVVKGDPALAGTAIAVYWTSPSASTPGSGTDVTAAGNGIWFLQQSSNAWQLLPVVQGSTQLSMTYFPAPSGPILSAYAYGPATSLSDRVASEVSSAIESAGGYDFQLYALHYGLLDELQSPVATALYQRMSTSTSAQQRILGLSGLIRSGSAAALASAAQVASTLAGYPKENGILLLSIRDYFRPTDANSIAVAGQAAADTTNPSLPFRQATAHALAAIRTAVALPYLGALLEDPDFNLRVEAIGGIGAFANGLPVQTSAGVPSLVYLQFPATAPYKTADTVASFALGSQAIAKKEASYLSFWKDWWSQNRAKLGY